jgi:hypothetical protein
MSTYEWALLTATEYYGPETRYTLAARYETLAETERAATQESPDWDESVKAYLLSHNQSAPTWYQVAPILAESFSGFYRDWSDLPSEVFNALPEEIGSDPATADEELTEALTARGLLVVEYPGDPWQYLVRVGPTD